MVGPLLHSSRPSSLTCFECVKHTREETENVRVCKTGKESESEEGVPICSRGMVSMLLKLGLTSLGFLFVFGENSSMIECMDSISE